jgi:DNA-binding PadR family transcriptional regulator
MRSTEQVAGYIDFRKVDRYTVPNLNRLQLRGYTSGQERRQRRKYATNGDKGVVHDGSGLTSTR